MVLHFFELPKLPGQINRDDMLLLWLSLFKANTEEELKLIKELGVAELSEAVNAYHSVTTSAEFQEMERLRIKASHDEAQALGNAERRGEERANVKWQSVVAEKDAALYEKDAELSEKDAALSEKDAALSEKEAALSEKDAALSEKDMIIAELRMQMDNR